MNINFKDRYLESKTFFFKLILFFGKLLLARLGQTRTEHERKHEQGINQTADQPVKPISSKKQKKTLYKNCNIFMKNETNCKLALTAKQNSWTKK